MQSSSEEMSISHAPTMQLMPDPERHTLLRPKVLLRRQTYTVKLERVEERKKASIYTSQGLDSTWLLINLSK